MIEDDDATDELKDESSTLFGYAMARLMNESDSNKVFAAATSTNLHSTNLGEEQDLMSALRSEIRRHFTNKYSASSTRIKCAAEIEALIATPFESKVALSSVHSQLLDDITPEEFWNASRECLGMLHPVQADVYVLREMEDVSCDEISEMTGLTFEAVLELVYRGRMTFVACLLKRIGRGK